MSRNHRRLSFFCATSHSAYPDSRAQSAESACVVWPTAASQGGEPAQPEPGKDLTAEEEALLSRLHGLNNAIRDQASRRGKELAALGRSYKREVL